MQDRYELLAANGARNIQDFNRKVLESAPLKRPRSKDVAFEADAYVGRSFGGRVCARVEKRCPRVLLGFPVRPPGRERPEDEAALLALRSPTLILQGSDDELGPLDVLEGLCAKNPALELEVIEGAGHAYGRHEKRVLERAAAWLVDHRA